MTDAATPSFPLILRTGPESLLFWRGHERITASRFLSDVADAALQLPARRYVLNLCQDRYAFAVGFAAALLRGQVSLLTSDRTERRLGDLRARYDDAYCLTDAGQRVTPDALILRLRGAAGGAANPAIAAPQCAAIVFTSGSTGEPVPHEKPWGSLVTCSLKAARRFGFDREPVHSIVGTVPPYHMYGFETTILLPMHASVASYCGDTFYPKDVERAFAELIGPSALVTTPLQLRALLATQAKMAPAKIISATAPLPTDMAAEAERTLGTEVFEIFGTTETGSIASRRTVNEPTWTTYEGVELRQQQECACASVPLLGAAIPLTDNMIVHDASTFELLGRASDIVKVAGKRASLPALNRILTEIDGVSDGTFLAPDDLEANPSARLVAFVVAPDRCATDILAGLRKRLDPPFLPRRVIMMDALPRNAVGKLPRSQLLALAARTVERPNP